MSSSAASRRHALVTGGSSGIGLAIAHELAERGYDLILVSNDRKRLHDAQRDIERTLGCAVSILFIDLARDDAALRIYRYCRARRLSVDVLVNNAGMFFFGEAADADIRKASAMMHLHVHTPSLLVSLFSREMRARRSGYILNVASIVSFKDFPGLAYYGATKRYLRAFTESVRSEMQEYGVSVTALFPGAVATDLYEAAFDLAPLTRFGIVMTARATARAGVRALFARKAECMPGVFNRLAVSLVRCVPRFIIDIVKKRSGIVPKPPLLSR